MKKLLAISLVLILIISFTTVTHAANDGLVISECGYMSQAGEKIENLNEETAVKGYAKIINSASVDGGFAMFLARYDKYDRLTAVKVKPISFTSDTYEATFVTPIIEATAGDGSYFKLFITKDLGEIQPLANVPALTAALKTLTVSYRNVEKVLYDANDNILFEYFESDEARQTTQITVDGSSAIYYNNCLVKQYELSTLTTFYGYITFEKKNSLSSADYDTIYIDDYETLVVAENLTEEHKVTSKNYTQAVIYDPEDTSVTAKLYDENGDEIAWESLKINDIVAIRRFSDGLTTVVTGNKIATVKVKGTINGVTEQDPNDIKYLINDREYGIDLDAFADEGFELGCVGVFYLDIMGNITHYETSPSKYAYIVKVGSNGSALDPRYALKMYTFDGQFDTIYLASHVKVDGISGITCNTDITSAITVSKSAAESSAIIFRQGTEWFNMSDDGGINSIKPIESGQVITYTVNSDGYITSIDRACDKNEVSSVTGRFTYAAKGQNLTYNADINSFSGSVSGKAHVTENTVIMVAPTMDDAGNIVTQPYYLTENDFALLGAANIADGQELINADIYDVRDNNEVGFILVNTEIEIPEPRSVMALVKGIYSTNDENGDFVYKISALQNGDVKDGIENEPLVTAGDDNYGVCAYDTIIPKYDLAGKVKGAVRAAYLNSSGTNVVFNAPADTDKVKYYYGKVTDTGARSLDLDTGKSINTMSATNVYVYDKGASTRVTIDDIDIIDFDYGQCYIEYDLCDAYVIAREYEGAIADLVLYIFRK